MNKAERLKQFGPIWAASGLLNFFGEGWPFHVFLKKWLGLCLVSLTFCAKTTTWLPRKGNMELDFRLMPSEKYPKCISLGLWPLERLLRTIWQGILGIALNAVGLSGPGAKDLFERGFWQERTEPFFLSFMSVRSTPKKRLAEWRAFLLLLKKMPPEFLALIAIQLNLSCPNVKLHGRSGIHQEGYQMLEEVLRLGLLDILLIVVKVSVTMSPEDARLIGDHAACSGICISNTIPFGWEGISRYKWLARVKWFCYFWSLKSPLAEFGGGGLSGAPLLFLVEKWVKEIRRLGFRKHVNAGGGILWPWDVDRLFKAGADSLSYGSGSFLRPFCSRFIIRRAYKLGNGGI